MTGQGNRPKGMLTKSFVLLLTASAATVLVYQGSKRSPSLDLPNRVPEAAPYLTEEARAFPPPYEEVWATENNPGQCRNCHQKIFDQWNGSMMSNSWRDPVWRSAFLLLARTTSAHGECDTPEPPDGTPKAKHNPFARPGECASTFDLGTRKHTVSRPGSLVDSFCSRCHMPTNYLDNVPLRNVKVDGETGIEEAPVDPRFHPTSDDGTGLAFATVDAQYRNTATGKSGIFCAVCHSFAATRDTPFHNYARAGKEYVPAVGAQPRATLLAENQQDVFEVADPTRRNLGYGIGAGSFRLSPHAILSGERFGPLSATDRTHRIDVNTSQVFGEDIPYQKMDSSQHQGFHHAMTVRSEMCAACHDVTNALPIKNTLGKWVGGFPIERTYTEWSNSRYADRPGNVHYDPRYKRDCQSCHMQQDFGQPGTAQTLYRDGKPLPVPVDRVAGEAAGAPRPFFTHHFVGGNAWVPHLIGKAVEQNGSVSPYPELSTFSFSSADPRSPYSRAVWTQLEKRGADTQQARLAWDRLRNVLSMDLSVPATIRPGTASPISITISNTGSGHDFPTGFPEGRIAWLSIHAYDLASGRELPIRDSVWKRSSKGVGNLTREEMVDPDFPGCDWKLPAGSPDPYSLQFKAVASLGDGCPTLDLPFAAPLNLVTDSRGLPIDEGGRVVGRENPKGLLQFEDRNGNGDLFDDSFLRDTRLKPMPHAGATVKVDRYSIEVPPEAQGPIAVTAAVHYQSLEAIVALKFLGNLADSNGNFVLEPCVLGGLCDGRRPASEPAAVEGSPPVPMIVRSHVALVEGPKRWTSTPRVLPYPVPGATDVYRDPVAKVSFSSPVLGVDNRSFTLEDSRGARVPGRVDQIGDATWGLFPDQIYCKPGETYTARLRAGICDPMGNCTPREIAWSFAIAPDGTPGRGDTTVPVGFELPSVVSQR